MPLDADLLNQAKTTEARAIDAEYRAVFARAEFHQAVRRLQLAGASLREIADAAAHTVKNAAPAQSMGPR
jgi:hypothetical protein